MWLVLDNEICIESGRGGSLPGESFEHHCERFSKFPLPSLVDGGIMCQDRSLIIKGPQWFWCPHTINKKCQKKANLCYLNHGNVEIVCYWSITLGIRTSQYLLSLSDFFFTLVTFAKPYWHLDSHSTWLMYIVLPLLVTPISLPNHPHDYLCCSKRFQFSMACQYFPSTHTPASLALTFHVPFLVPNSHSNPASGNSPEKGRSSLEQLPTRFPIVSLTPYFPSPP